MAAGDYIGPRALVKVCSARDYFQRMFIRENVVVVLYYIYCTRASRTHAELFAKKSITSECSDTMDLIETPTELKANNCALCVHAKETGPRLVQTSGRVRSVRRRVGNWFRFAGLFGSLILYKSPNHCVVRKETLRQDAFNLDYRK